ncbi:hypothetical protein AVEN_204249-1 [Araneus ventricosus]|uniref:Uncharacterized protein n=1 Tax=Araneus ventricosus TaxID=182803 RepID=A0A4Y2PZH6_ARAVE|nr:hypothetical protein AVEN_204249-1 [Araneus ventricosus]
MYRSFQNETNPLPKLWIRISDSESESVISNPRTQSESNSYSQIRFRSIVPFCRFFPSGRFFEDPDQLIRSEMNDRSVVGFLHVLSQLRFDLVSTVS